MQRIQLSWKTFSKGVVIVAIMGLAALCGRVIHARWKLYEKQTSGPIAYTTILQETVHGPDGSVRKGMELTCAIRSDGAFARRIIDRPREVFVGSEKKVVDGDADRSLHFASGLEVVINEITNTKSSTLARNVSPARWQRDPTSKCLNSFEGKPFSAIPESLQGEETVSGFRAAKILNGNVTFWFALDYGCALVKDRWEFGGQEFSEKELVKLTAGEPDNSLFAVPKDIREVTPSERILGPKKDCTSCQQKSLAAIQRLDRDYEARRAPIP